MKIEKLMPMPAIVGQVTIAPKISMQQSLKIDYSGDIKQVDTNKFIISIIINLSAYSKDRFLFMPTTHQFEVALEEVDIKLKGDRDYWAMADIVQMSIAQARILLMQEMQKRAMPVKLIPFEPIQAIYEKVKNGYFSLWN